MWGMFRFVSEFFDHSLDKVLSGPAGPGFGKSMGAIGAILFGSVIVMIAAVALAISGRTIEAPQYHLVKDGAPIGRLPVLNSPSLSVEKITLWSERAARDIFRFSFRDYESRMADNAVYFTPAAWRDFSESMEKTQMLKNTREQRQFVILTPLEDAQLIGRGTVGGKMVLRVEIPVIITYIGGEKPVYQKQLLELFLLPVPPEQSPEGLAIAKLRAHSYK